MLKIKAIFLLISSLILFPWARAHGEEQISRVYFIDACSGTQTFVRTPNGTKLKLELKKLIPNTIANITIEYVPSGLSDELAGKYKQINRFTTRSNHDGNLMLKLSMPSDRSMNAVEAKSPGHNIWNANVSWYQTDSNNKMFASSAYSSVYRMQGIEPFFKVTSERECSWETAPSINSEYYYNDSRIGVMTVKRETVLSTGSQGLSGFSLGNQPIVAGDLFTIPLGTINPYLPAFGWFFKTWSTQRGLVQDIETTRSWDLSRESGGYFFDRFSFNRVAADRYEWVRSSENGCGSFKKTATGNLDVGARMSEFYTVPVETSGSPDRVLQFLEKERPTRDSCETGVQATATRADYLISSDGNNMMFFYPNTLVTNE